MFIFDSLFVSGLRWVLTTVSTAADAEMNDDTALREQLLAAEMRRELGEMTDEEFGRLEADLVARIREIRERREGGSAPFAVRGEALSAPPDAQFAVEATLSGDFHEPVEPAAAPVTEPVTARRAGRTAARAPSERSIAPRRSRPIRRAPPPARTRRRS